MKYRRINEPKRNKDNRMKKLTYFLLAAMVLTLGSCKENYSQGEKVGNLIELTKTRSSI